MSMMILKKRARPGTLVVPQATPSQPSSPSIFATSIILPSSATVPSRWLCQRTPIIWYKGSVGHNPIPAIGFRRSYECILFAYKGNKPCKGLVDDVISIRPDFEQTHAASKPVELYQKLLSRTCVIGDRVLDPCCGSGTIFPAATGLSLKATGIELNERFANLLEEDVCQSTIIYTGIDSTDL